MSVVLVCYYLLHICTKKRINKLPLSATFFSRMSMKSHKNIKFLENFNPETSARERRKLSRRNYQDNPRKSKSIYNERGLIAATGKDLCDCLDETCPGCHFPCPRCNSLKCGLECRVNRKWMYDKIEIEGNDFVIKNDYKNQ